MVKESTRSRIKVSHVVTPKDPALRRRELSRPQILDEALRLIDATGLAAFTMQILARRLGVTPMALYRHFNNKDDLLRAVAALVLSDMVLPDPAQPWLEQLRQLGVELKRVLDRHPHATPLCSQRMAAFPGVVPVADSAIRATEMAGLPPWSGIRFAHAVTNYTLGFCLDAADYQSLDPLAPLGDPFEGVEVSLVPHAASQAGFLKAFANQGGYASQEQYEFGLDLLVAGFESWAATPA